MQNMQRAMPLRAAAAAAAHRPPPAPPAPPHRVWCRRLPSEVSRVTQTLQLDAEELEELFASVLDFPSDRKPVQRGGQAAAAAEAGGAEPGPGSSDGAAAGSNAAATAPAAAAEEAAAAGSAAAAAKPHSKKLCGNVAADQPDLIGARAGVPLGSAATLLRYGPLAGCAAGCAHWQVCRRAAGLHAGSSRAPPPTPQAWTCGPPPWHSAPTWPRTRAWRRAPTSASLGRVRAPGRMSAPR